MQKKFEKNRTKIKGGCQSGRKVVPHNSKSDLPLVERRELSQKTVLSSRSYKFPQHGEYMIISDISCQLFDNKQAGVSA